MSPSRYEGSWLLASSNAGAVILVGYLLGLHGILALAGSGSHLALRDHDDETCAPYYYAPVNSRLSSFPTIWEPAYILHGDTNAEDKWNSIKPTVPNISTKGTPMGDFSRLNYSESDDDCWWTYSKCVNPKLDDLPGDITSIPEPHTLAYGFDDGPNCSHNAFYDYLVEQKQKATMFYIGSNVMDWPLEAQRAVKDGHEICVHTWSHRYMTALGSREVFAELYYTMQAIRLVANVTPTCWRPPFGDVDNRVRAIAHGLGLRTILWKYDTNDWRVEPNGDGSVESVDATYENIMKEAAKGTFDTSGAIMLAHELNNFTMSEAMKFYEKLRSSFKNLVPLAVALNNTHPYVEDTGSLGDFDSYTQASSRANSTGLDPAAAASVNSTAADTPSGDNPEGVGGPGMDESVVPSKPSSSSTRRLHVQFPLHLFPVFLTVLVVFRLTCPL